jgi:hypothetical protein
MLPSEASENTEERNMKILKIGVVLFVLMLAGMAMVPMVSADELQDANAIAPEGIVDLTNSQEDVIIANYVPVDTAYIDAKLALIEFVSLGALDNKDTWIGATIDSRPTIINDVNGKMLFYLFTIENHNEKIGEIRIAANKILGGSLISIGPQTQPVDPVVLKRILLSKIEEQDGKSAVVFPGIVSYAYPEIGMVAQFTDPLTNGKKTIAVDAYDYSVQIENSAQIKGDSKFYSVYSKVNYSISADLIASWTKIHQETDAARKSGLISQDSVSAPLSRQQIDAYTTNMVNTRAVTEYYVISGVPLYAQPNENWCAVTTARMISAKYGVYRTLQEIANKMGVGGGGGTTPANELVYYRASVASGGLGKTQSDVYDYIYWAESKTEINNNRPFKVGNYGGHARASTGYLRSPSTGYTYFYFKDPAPINQGSEYWEWFNEMNPVFYNNHIKVK